MITVRVNKLAKRLNKQGTMRFLGAATKEQIDCFEKENKIQLPTKYEEWLRYCDGGEFFLPAGAQLYGVAHKPLIDLNDNDRPNNTYTVIGSLASGDPILCKSGEEKIYIYDHENQRIDEDLVYDDIFGFLEDLYDLLGIGE